MSQEVEVIEPFQKDRRLLDLLRDNRKAKILVFCLYKKEAARVEGQLQVLTDAERRTRRKKRRRRRRGEEEKKKRCKKKKKKQKARHWQQGQLVTREVHQNGCRRTETSTASYSLVCIHLFVLFSHFDRFYALLHLVARL